MQLAVLALNVKIYHLQTTAENKNTEKVNLSQ